MFTLQLFKTISGICSKNNGGPRKKSSQFQVCYSGFLRCRQVVARDSYKWVSYKKVVSGWWWVVVDIFWLVVGGGGYILAGGG